MSPSFSPTDLHAENVGRLRPEDVVIASYPGSGAALIGNVLLSLGLAYVDPYTEVVGDHGGGPAWSRLIAIPTNSPPVRSRSSRWSGTLAMPSTRTIGGVSDSPRKASRGRSRSSSNVGTSTENGRLMPGRRSVNGGGALAAKRVRPTGTSRSASSASSLIL